MVYKTTKAHEIERKLKDEKELEKLLNDYSEGFELVDSYGEKLRNHMLDTPQDLDMAITELGGWFVTLNTVCALSETMKMNAEESHKQVKQANKAYGVQAPDGSDKIQLYRRIRNIFQVYCDNCEKIISICQSRMRSLDREKTLS